MLNTRFRRTIVVLALAALSPALITAQENLRQQVDRHDRDIDELRSEITELRSRSTTPGLAGAKGDPGPQGQRGPRGERGPAGRGIASDSTGDYLELKRASGALAVRLGVNATTGGFGRFLNPQRRRVVWLGADDGHHGHVSLYDSSGTDVVYLGAGTSGSGLLRVSNHGGEQVAYIGASSTDNGLVNLYDDSGVKRLTLVAGSGGGRIEVDGTQVHDYAEVFDLHTRNGVSPGTVMSVVAEGVELAPSGTAYDRRVVGVISGAGGFRPGMSIGSRADGSKDFPIAMSGQVYVRVVTEGGSIEPGDLLVASSHPGVAMRASDFGRAFGAVVGKALEPYQGAGEGLVRMLVMVR